MALLRSEVLGAVEQAIATEVGMRVVEDFSAACTAYTMTEMSVSGMSVAETEALLVAHRDGIIRFGIAFLRHEAAKSNSGGQPQDDEEAESETVEVRGLGVGFGIKYAIYYNFLARRKPAEFRAFLKHRRISRHAKRAQELRQVFDSVQ
jgi:hypothetical protein